MQYNYWRNKESGQLTAITTELNTNLGDEWVKISYEEYLSIKLDILPESTEKSD